MFGKKKTPAPEIGPRNREELLEYIQRKDIAEGLLASAKNLHNRFKGNRFTLEQMVKKTSIGNTYNAVQLMNLLELKGLAHKEQAGKEIKYKITISIEEQIATLEFHLAQLNMQTAATQTQIAKLKEEQQKLQKVK